MDADFFQNSPFRSPQWRADRVLELVSHRKGPLRPRRFDDRFVRPYRYFLLQYLAADVDEDKLHAVIAEWPHVYWAHSLQFGRDSERREILQARVLTGEAPKGIAKRFSMEEASVEFYEKLFFDVRDRLAARDWIAKVVLQTSTLMAPAHRGTTPEQQRGLMYKFFGFHGGPLVLDAMITGMAHTPMPKRAEDISGWFEDAVAQIVKSRAAAAAPFFEVNKQNIISLLKLALRAKEVGKVLKTGAQVSQADREKQVEQIVTAMERSTVPWKRPESTGDEPPQPIGPFELPASQQSSGAMRQTTAEIELDPDLLISSEVETDSAGELTLERLAI